MSVLRAESTSATGSHKGSRLRGALVIAQVALSAVLLIGAGLFLRSLQSLRGIDVGFSPEGVIAVDIDATSAALGEAAVSAMYRELGGRLESVPGVESASFTSRLPLSRGGLRAGVHIDGNEPRPGQSSLKVSFTRVGVRYFETLRIALVAGRDFSDRDDANHPGVVIVDETMAQRFWPGADPLAQSVRLADEAENRELAGRHMSVDTLRVIGVARNVKYQAIGEEPEAHMYVPYAQRHDALGPRPNARRPRRRRLRHTRAFDSECGASTERRGPRVPPAHSRGAHRALPGPVAPGRDPQRDHRNDGPVASDDRAVRSSRIPGSPSGRPSSPSRSHWALAGATSGAWFSATLLL